MGFFAKAAAPPERNDTESSSLDLRIEPVIERAEQIAQRVAVEMPTHLGLASASRGVANVAREAQKVSRKLKRYWGWHRLPLFFLIAALALLATWLYVRFVHVSRLRIAVSQRDAVMLRDKLDGRILVRRVDTAGSRQSIELLQDNQVDLAFVQGGVAIPSEFLRNEMESPEAVLFYLRDGKMLEEIRRVLTSVSGQGSHSMATDFARIWSLEDQVAYEHSWTSLTEESDYVIPADIDAIFIVADPLSAKLTSVQKKIHDAGFALASPDIGAYSLRRPYLREMRVRQGYLHPSLHLPAEAVDTYSVATYLVANPNLSPRQLAAAKELVVSDANRLDLGSYAPTFGQASEALQGVEAVLNIIVYVGLAFLALLGLEIYTYRGRFNELNSLISLISMHQSSKDIIGSNDIAHTVKYLAICSDLLGLISVIAGYYIQENSSLMYNNQVEILHERTDALKLNIQLKILHALIELPQKTSLPQASEDPAATVEP